MRIDPFEIERFVFQPKHGESYSHSYECLCALAHSVFSTTLYLMFFKRIWCLYFHIMPLFIHLFYSFSRSFSLFLKTLSLFYRSPCIGYWFQVSSMSVSWRYLFSYLTRIYVFISICPCIIDFDLATNEYYAKWNMV